MPSASHKLEPPGIILCEFELGDGPQRLDLSSAHHYRAALVFVRLHGTVVGQVPIDLTAHDALSLEVEAVVRRSLSQEIEDHLRVDREAGTSSNQPACITARDSALTSAPPLTVVVPTRDHPERLQRCLSSLLSGSYPLNRLELLVVDNASRSEATKSVVESFHDVAQVRYLFEPRSGSASARNRALPEIATELVVFTDDDTRADTHWLIEIVRGFSSEERAGVVSGLLLPSHLDTQAQVWFEEYGGFSRGFARRVFDVSTYWPLDEPLFPFAAGLFGTGNNMAFRTEVLRSIGGFDPALGNGTPALGGVDSEVLLRSILLGHRLVYQPSALVYHEHRRDYASLKRQLFSYGSGLSAYLCKTLWNNPQLLPSFLNVLPRGIRFATDPRSPINSRKGKGYPASLTLTEWAGMMYGPIAYARSRQAYGPHIVPKAVSEAARRPPARD
jgi:glycosyltransferase involved in cell wall biosynthesis